MCALGKLFFHVVCSSIIRKIGEIMHTVTLTIAGMTCDHCVMAVRKALTELIGVEVFNVEIGSASVTWDHRRVSLQDIIKAVESAGFSVTAT